MVFFICQPKLLGICTECKISGERPGKGRKNGKGRERPKNGAWSGFNGSRWKYPSTPEKAGKRPGKGRKRDALLKARHPAIYRLSLCLQSKSGDFGNLDF